MASVWDEVTGVSQSQQAQFNQDPLEMQSETLTAFP